METHCIPYTELPHVTRLFADYLYDFPRVREFYPLNPYEEASFADAARSLEYSDSLRKAVVSVLEEQNRAFSAGEAANENLRKLARPGCFAVVTGQQTGLFSGPVFAFYKALTAIKLARTLTARGLEAVPVFWLATEDHDLAEVNHCFVQDRDGAPQRLEYAGEPPVPDAPVGAVRLTDAIQAPLDALTAFLPESPHRVELLETLRDCYRPGEGLATAFGRLMARLFAAYGVVLVDSLDERLHALSAHVFQAAVESAVALGNELQDRSRRLVESGYHAQVRTTENSSLLFQYEAGRRRPLRLQDGLFTTSDGESFSPQEILTRLREQPQVLSPNVLLRPVMQDALLPTIAYVGGPSELAYLAQAAPVYQRVLGRMPVIVPRASFTLLEPHAHRLLEKYGLTLLDVCSGKQALRDKMAARFLPPDLAAAFQTAAAGLTESLEALQASLAKLDPTLADAAANSGRKMHYQLSTLERKAAQAAQSRSEQVERDAVRLENSLYPHKTLQERHYSGINYLARYGPSLLDQIYEQISAECSNHQVALLG
ncbi:MAG: bacillithiol biosynthesis cysteine-adding enzyme BshC [Terriglobia bacterium]